MKKMINKRYRFTGVKNHIKLSKKALNARNKFVLEINKKEAYRKLNCFVCGLKEFDLISEIDRYGFFYPTSICKNCGNVQQNKYYSEEILNKFYSKYYRSIYEYVSKEQFFKQQRIHGENIKNFLGWGRNTKNVLEVGCGAGGILSIFRDLGSNVLGLDFDKDYLQIAEKNNIPVKNGSLEKLDPYKKFDLIILSHVLEHIVNPINFLEDLSKYLTNEGIIFIEVPSLEKVLNHPAFKYDLLNYLQNAHTAHYTVKSLRLLCKKSGLKCTKSNELIYSTWKISKSTKKITKLEIKNCLEYNKKLLIDIENKRKNILSFLRLFLFQIKKVFKNNLTFVLSLIGLKIYNKRIKFKNK